MKHATRHAGAERDAAPPTVLTRQLRLRRPTPADVGALHAIQGDREAMVHTFWAPDRDATAAWLDAYARRVPIDGFGPWTAVLRSDGRVVGWGGLCVDPHDPRWGSEVAYFIAPSRSAIGRPPRRH